MRALLLVCLGGACGSGARYAIGIALTKRFGLGFPYGTFAVNAIGSLAMGLVMYAAREAHLLAPAWQLALGTGLMGGFTTYSSFSYELLQYLQHGHWARAALYTVLTVSVCLAGCGAGFWIGRALLPSA